MKTHCNQFRIPPLIPIMNATSQENKVLVRLNTKKVRQNRDMPNELIIGVYVENVQMRQTHEIPLGCNLRLRRLFTLTILESHVYKLMEPSYSIRLGITKNGPKALVHGQVTIYSNSTLFRIMRTRDELDVKHKSTDTHFEMPNTIQRTIYIPTAR